MTTGHRADLPSRISSATTRAGPVRASPNDLVAPGEIVASPETRLRYRVERRLGEGGFGQAYLAGRRGLSRIVPATVCLKVRRIDGWLREAYFGQLLDGDPWAIRVYDALPLVRP
jgi:hypothetical protein